MPPQTQEIRLKVLRGLEEKSDVSQREPDEYEAPKLAVEQLKDELRADGDHA